MDEPTGIVDAGLRLIMVLALIGWNALESLSLRTPYPDTTIVLWDSPIWRLILLFTVWLGAEWCPRVGLLTGMAVSMYIINMIQVS
jgi:hypothetical protein